MVVQEKVANATSTCKKRMTSVKAWHLEKQESSLAPHNVWTNIDNDVTPMWRRTWSTWTILGFWFSDALNMQGWENPSSVISVGLTYREAIVANIMGMVIVAIPLVLNGAVGSTLHVPYPVAIRSSFGYYFGRFAVVVRMITALFWHSIQTFSGSYALTLCIAAIWPSYLDIPNHIPESIGLTSQQMVSQLLFWLIQLPVLTFAPHRLKWFFILKAVVVSLCVIGVAAGMCGLAKSSGAIFDQTAKVHGSKKGWLTMACIMSNTGGWATMATNIPDFTRYVKSGNAQWFQALFLPVISFFLAIMAILATSASGVVYGEYYWDPTVLASQWTGPGGRAASFFVGFSWVIGQIGTNLSANVITAANDLSSLFPKYINIRRGAIIITIIGGWVMQPWKIINSASSLLTFMSGLAIFLAPVAAIQACDFWFVKKKKIDVPALYDPNGIYYYDYGINWRALVAFLIALCPNLPGLAHAVNSSNNISVGAQHLYDMNYLYGFYSALVVYYVLNYFWPHAPTTLDILITGDDIIAAEDSSNESTQQEIVVEGKNM